MNSLLACYKNGDLCTIEYETEEGSEFFEGVKLLQFHSESLVVEVNGESLTLEPERILRSSYYKENMYWLPDGEGNQYAIFTLQVVE